MLAMETSQLSPPQVFVRRRAALAQVLGEQGVLLYCGSPRPRNYPATIFPFRGDSSFLYFVGTEFPQGVLRMHRGRSTLYLFDPGPDDALWHGQATPWSEIARKTGVENVENLDQLQAIESPSNLATLPAVDLETRISQSRFLGRSWTGSHRSFVLLEQDQKLMEAIIRLRLENDEAAITEMKAAIQATQAGHLAAMAITRPGLFEYEICAQLEFEFAKRNTIPAYSSIVTVHGEVLHNTERNNRLQAGELLLVDAGAEHHGWASDITRTWPVSGRFSPTQRALYDIVLQAQLDSIAMVRPGVRYRDIHLRSCLTLAQGLVDEGILQGNPENLVERGAHAIFYPHGTGHLLGLDTHDMENFGDHAGYPVNRNRDSQFGLKYLRLDRDLAANMVVTIEPGFYQVPAILNREDLAGKFIAEGSINRDKLSRFADVRGIRIEDDVLCTQQGAEVLSNNIPKSANDIEAQVGQATV